MAGLPLPGIRIGIGIAAQQAIHVFHPAKIRANGDVFHCTAMSSAALGLIPGTQVLLPGNLARGRGQVDIHVGSLELLHGGHISSINEMKDLTGFAWNFNFLQ